MEVVRGDGWAWKMPGLAEEDFSRWFKVCVVGLRRRM